MSSEKRKYELKERADKQEETRRRIVAATAALHAEVGPAKTTVAAVARRAGVQRVTVYSHFPDEEHLIAACAEHSYAANPPPDLGDSMTISDPGLRLRTVLVRMYGWYRASEAVFTRVMQDRGAVPALDRILQRVMDSPQSELAAGLAAGFGGDDRVRAMVRLALDYWSWRLFAEEGLDDEACADSMTRAVMALSSNRLHARS